MYFLFSNLLISPPSYVYYLNQSTFESKRVPRQKAQTGNVAGTQGYMVIIPTGYVEWEKSCLSLKTT